ncbi:AraC family transcriptional regulator [Alteromonas sediminis]|uniref:AraC family transcriptional regulator n=1 Tax=Alteromonas sediminis TaxID=2259342 RepID=A0A3N5Y0F2_9ALTE|nr:AraC family transcriptional regulator [Alteromonas sediminis]RPJ66550.1 AraC family transcriptional regulator [Alteromonas sediminis]
MHNLNGILNQHSFATTVNYSGEFAGVRHFGQSGQLHLLESGQVRIVRQGGSEILLDRPSMVLLPVAVKHRVESLGEQPARMISASISFCETRSSLLIDALPQTIYFQLSPDCSVSCTARWLLHEVFEQRFARQEMLDKLGEVFILQILRHVTEQGTLQQGKLLAINHPQLSKVIDKIHCHPAENWTLDNLAQLAAMSRSKFAECFKALVGQTPIDYITDVRIAAAQKLLKHNKPVNLVAGAVGYEHGSALARIFKKKLGVSPREWLKQTNEDREGMLSIGFGRFG